MADTTPFPTQGPLRQSTIINALDAAGSSSGKPKKARKRNLTLANGETLDLNKIDSGSATRPDVIDALKRRIVELEDALEAAQPPPAKRARKSTATAGDDEEEGTKAADKITKANEKSAKADEKKRRAHLKTIFDRLKKEVKSDAVKFQGGPRTVKFDEVLDAAVFDLLFADRGRLEQPRPDNKPGSTVTIIEFNKSEDVDALFGPEMKALKGNRWSVGGLPTVRRGYGFGFGGFGSRTFSKSEKMGAVDVNVQSLSVNWSKNTMKCTLKFDVAAVGGVSEWDDDL